ncbi:hypothetical protein DMUE_1094 [Dictyocoela muelleri]|nr:hypothetical protein DMUE_1094 [Dictyocoela muelleri]
MLSFNPCFSIFPFNYLKEEIEKLENFLLKSKIEEIYEIWLDFKKYYCSDVDEKSAKSIFSVLFWSVVSRLSSNIPITTNCLEGWHRSLNNNFLKAHPSLYEFGIELKKQHSITENKINQLFICGQNILNDKENIFSEKITKYDTYPDFQYSKVIASLLKAR